MKSRLTAEQIDLAYQYTLFVMIICVHEWREHLQYYVDRLLFAISSVPIVTYLLNYNTASLVGILCQTDVVSTSMRRHHVALTLIRRHTTSFARWEYSQNMKFRVTAEQICFAYRIYIVSPNHSRRGKLRTVTIS